ncbi:KIF-binding protein-like [Odontomachus brunneus]|uniref:KIF-binding protein-like n=1 Tax=Odontomachus brunneus TaxID=486640 RepID=UPI0013F25EC7|nr:KIF-binding protein-like [Odontomachus brunneus]
MDQKHDIVDSASITKTESVENIEDAEDMMMNITKRLAADFKVLKHLIERPLLKRQTTPSFIYEHQIEAIKSLDIHLDQHFNEITDSKDSKLDDVVVLAASFVLMCQVKFLRNSILQQEDLHVAEFLLMRSIILLKDKELNSKSILTSIQAYHELGFIYSKLKDIKKSLRYLNKTFELYLAYTKGQDEFPAPISIETILNIQVKSDAVCVLDNVCMASLSILLRLNNYEHGSIDMEKVVIYMHKLLKKVLIIFKPFSINYTEWTFEAIQLAEYFLSCRRFIECKNHLCAASIMMIKCYEEMYMAFNEEMCEKDKDIVHRRFKIIVSIIDMIWVKYGLVILSLSRKRLLQKEEENNLCEINKSKTESITQPNKKFTELLMFTATEEKFRKFTYTMPDDYITNYADAKMLFVQILQLLNNLKVKEFASVSLEFGTQIAHYTSKAYKYLAFYENDKIKQIKLQKRRIDVLEDYLKTTCTNDNFINCTFLWFELAVVYSTLINIKLKNLELSELTAEDSVEINSLVKNSVHYFQLYVNICEHTNPQGNKDNQIMSCFNLTYNKTTMYADLYEKYLQDMG